MLASTQTLSSDTRPTALVVEKADNAEITSVPGCSEFTSVDGAVERCAHDRMIELALHLVDLGLRLPVLRQLTSIGRSRLPPSLASWTLAVSCSELSVFCAVTSAKCAGSAVMRAMLLAFTSAA